VRSIACLGLVSIVAISCHEEPVTVDLRDQALGAYTYNMKVLEMTDAGLLPVQEAGLSGSFELIKGTGEAEIQGQEGKFFIFSGQKIGKVTKGFTFEVKDQVGSAGGTEITLQGYNGIKYEEEHYQGLYLSAEKTLKVYFTFSQNHRNFVVAITGVKL